MSLARDKTPDKPKSTAPLSHILDMLIFLLFSDNLHSTKANAVIIIVRVIAIAFTITIHATASRIWLISGIATMVIAAPAVCSSRRRDKYQDSTEETNEIRIEETDVWQKQGYILQVGNLLPWHLMFLLISRLRGAFLFPQRGSAGSAQMLPLRFD